MHFLRNALDNLPRKQTDDCLAELHWLFDRHTLEEWNDANRYLKMGPLRELLKKPPPERKVA